MSTYSEKLDAYLKDARETETDFAERLETTQVSVNRYRKGSRFPGSDMARRIDAETKGKVSFSDWQKEFLSRSGVAA